MIENLARVEPDEVSQWEAFVKLAKAGRNVEEIAAAFAFAAIINPIITHAAFTTPARSGASSGPPIEVADALKISSHDQVLDLGLRKMEALAAILARVTDERTAREVCPAAERCYI